MRTAVRSVVRPLGLDVVSFSPAWHPVARRAALLRTYGVNLVLDVGANVGQYARGLREAGYAGRIVSFEPLGAAFERLQRSMSGDPGWSGMRLALGDRDGEIEINVSENLQSSSALEVLPSLLNASPESRYVGRETAGLRRLDSIFDEIVGADERVLLKLDVQGFEPRVLEGAAGSMSRIAGLQLECSIRPMYSGEPVLEEMVARLARQGFVLMGADAAFADGRTGRVHQLDCLFFRELAGREG